MTEPYDFIFRHGTIVNHDGPAVRDLAVRDGRIAGIGDLRGAVAAEIVDCTNLHILPGVIDTQVHFREPGDGDKEDLASGSRAAVIGGVTGVFDMPNTTPATTNAAALADKIARAGTRTYCDFAFWIGATPGNIGDIPELERLPAVAGIKVFMGASTGELLVGDDHAIAAILAATRRRAAFHAEDESRLAGRRALRADYNPASHSLWRDEGVAIEATRRLLRLARGQRAPIHVLHVSTIEEMRLLAEHKDVASVELTPQHLTFSAEDYPRLGTKLQMNPPVRAPHHRDGLWWGLRQGIADILGSDHAPHTLAEKQRPYPHSPSGMTGVQTLVPIMLNHVNDGRLSLERFVDMTSAGPARLFGIASKGRIAVGFDADLTIVDLKRRETIRDRWIVSRCGWTPYDGHPVTGWPVGTFVRGRRVMWDGEVTEPAKGAPIRFITSL